MKKRNCFRIAVNELRAQRISFVWDVLILFLLLSVMMFVLFSNAQLYEIVSRPAKDLECDRAILIAHTETQAEEILRRLPIQILEKKQAGADINYTITGNRLQDLYPSVKYLLKNGFGVLYSEELLKSLQTVSIMLISVTFILVLALIGVFSHLLQTYIERRQNFYAINQALGMTNKDVRFVLFLITETLFLLTFLPAVGLSFFGANGMVSYANKLFGTRSVTVFSPQAVPITFLLAQLVVLFVLIRSTTKKMHFISAIKREL